MSKIVLDLSSKKAIDQAILKLKRIEQNQAEMRMDFLEFICKWVINRANIYLDASDIGSNIKSDIRKGWDFTVYANLSAKIINKSDHAAFVEFGVGSVGSQQSHPNAQNQKEESYNYNSGSHILPNGLWFFTKYDKEDIDLKDGYYQFSGSNQNTVLTKGSPAVMFAYNAVVDAKNDLMNPLGDFAKEWNKIVERYIG